MQEAEQNAINEKDLQLEYLYAGKVDCIYIDHPYNTGAKDWKYNNDYVDSVDTYRHSKWLSMMKKRLLLAKRLLNPVDSIMVITMVGRIQLIRKGKDATGHDRFKRLDVAKSAVRDKVSYAMTNDELDHIFETDGFFM